MGAPAYVTLIWGKEYSQAVGNIGQKRLAAKRNPNKNASPKRGGESSPGFQQQVALVLPALEAQMLTFTA